MLAGAAGGIVGLERSRGIFSGCLSQETVGQVGMPFQIDGGHGWD